MVYRYLLFLVCFSSYTAQSISEVAGLTWGQTPAEVRTRWQGRFQTLNKTEDSSGRLLFELRYKGKLYESLPEGHISAVFYLNRLFAVSVAYGSDKKHLATNTFEKLVARMKVMLGPYEARNFPPKLQSGIATKDLPYLNEFPPKQAAFMDMQIRTGSWAPSAHWRYPNGARVRILIMRGENKAGAMPALSPLLIFSKPNLLE